MPLVDAAAPTIEDIIAFQRDTTLSDTQMGLAIIGDVSDPGAKFREMKAPTNLREPTKANLLAFRYLKALHRIVSCNPHDGEELYHIAFNALPAALQ